MLNSVRFGCVAIVFNFLISGAGFAEPVPRLQIGATPASFTPVPANAVMDRLGGASGAEIKMAAPQQHKIQLLLGGGARVSIWNGSRYERRAFTVVKSKIGSRICLDRTATWIGGCIEFVSNGRDVRCRYLWNNGSRGAVACRIRPITSARTSAAGQNAGLTATAP